MFSRVACLKLSANQASEGSYTFVYCIAKSIQRQRKYIKEAFLKSAEVWFDGQRRIKTPSYPGLKTCLALHKLLRGAFQKWREIYTSSKLMYWQMHRCSMWLWIKECVDINDIPRLTVGWQKTILKHVCSCKYQPTDQTWWEKVHSVDISSLHHNMDPST